MDPYHLEKRENNLPILTTAALRPVRPARPEAYDLLAPLRLRILVLRWFHVNDWRYVRSPSLVGVACARH